MENQHHYDLSVLNKRTTLETSYVFKDIFGASTLSNEIRSMWNIFSLSEFQKYIADNHITSVSVCDARKSCIDYIVQTTFKNSYGSGQHYELYEERRQDDLNAIIDLIDLTDDEMKYFKDKSEHCDDFQSFCVKCEDCGSEVSPYEDAQSLSMESQSLCYSCLHERYI